MRQPLVPKPTTTDNNRRTHNLPTRMTSSKIHKKFRTKKRIAAYYAGGKATVGRVGRRLQNGNFRDFFVPKVRGVVVSRPSDGRWYFRSAKVALTAAIQWIDHCKTVAA